MPIRGVLASLALAAIAVVVGIPQGTSTAGTTGTTVTLEHGHNRAGACTRGLVALTFDDGPRPHVTQRLVRTLHQLHVPATFFEIGRNVAAHPAISRFVVAHGFAVENHSWSHPPLTRLSNVAGRAQIHRTVLAFRAARVRPGDLMRPPYGAINRRVARVIRHKHLVPELWNVDSGDWRGGSSAQITASVLAQLEPHRPNIVLQHDGVTNSPASVAAVPGIVRKARHRGYCFAPLGADGRPVPPTPHLAVTALPGQEGVRPVRLVLRLDAPTSVPTSVRLTSADGTAHAGEDYAPLDTVVRFRRGVTYALVRVPVSADGLPESPETFTVHVGDAVGLRPAAPDVAATISD